MALKTYNPVTPNERHLVLVDRSALDKRRPGEDVDRGPAFERRPEQQRLHHDASMAAATSGLSHVDFKRRRWDQPATVERLEYDPNRTAFIALIQYTDGELAYILAPQRLAVWRHGGGRRASRREAGQRDAARQYADRHDRSQHRAQDRQGRADRAFGRHLCADRRPRRRLRHRAAEFGRAAPGPGRCMGTIGRCRTPTT